MSESLSGWAPSAPCKDRLQPPTARPDYVWTEMGMSALQRASPRAWITLCIRKAKDAYHPFSLHELQAPKTETTPGLTCRSIQKAFGQRNTSPVKDGAFLGQRDDVHIYMLNAEIRPTSPFPVSFHYWTSTTLKIKPISFQEKMGKLSQGI